MKSPLAPLSERGVILLFIKDAEGPYEILATMIPERDLFSIK